jgi:hypothetical protein
MSVPGLDHPLEQRKVLSLLEGAHGVGEFGAEASLLVGARPRLLFTLSFGSWPVWQHRRPGTTQHPQPPGGPYDRC